ncbi:uncharacterized protein LOC143115438 isoform X2 [Alosa pseudoharengus]|uniref:uncharacterized protein LOC143115438 isoform X2 n=1 Tax=Alosa pseudoharengus TaxID=34774 RepID=UPI003F8AD09E
MSLYNVSLLLPLLMAFAVTFANRFWGGSATYYPKGVNPDGSYKVEFRFKQTFDSCEYLNWTTCYSGECGSVISLEKGVIYNTSGRNAVNFNWCQTEGVMTRQIPTQKILYLSDLGCCWVDLTNRFTDWNLLAYIDLGNRSDTNKANRPPVSMSMSFVRVPQNCPRTYELIMFDPDKDQVICANAFHRIPAGFTLNQIRIKEKDFCTVSYNSASVGLYGVDLIVLDKLQQPVNVTNTNGSISSTFPYPQGSTLGAHSLQFAVKVDPAVASCDEGVYLPAFLHPTPENGEQIQAVTNQELEIVVKATASAVGVRGIIISGPLNITVDKYTDSSEEFVLRWTPRSDDFGEYFPICFIAESNQVNNTYYQSGMRCIIVEVGQSEVVVGLRMMVESKTPLTEREIEETVLKQYADFDVPSTSPPATTASSPRPSGTVCLPRHHPSATATSWSPSRRGG